ncbi:transglycosylase SLT domain-containing protein [Candidatus Woesearchaeota archaeon]|nr:transglycosylase SLT domain-containing protein [Candidatus Woesearchaeota archaeon]
MKKALPIAAILAMFPATANDMELPVVAPVSVYEIFIDDTPIEAKITAEWRKIPVRITLRDIDNDGFFWRNAHLSDWDVLPEGLRERGLERMIEKYRHLLNNPLQWDKMRAEDWDYVPQPVRSIAYMNMVSYWSNLHEPGARYNLDRKEVSSAIKAIVIRESWFEHRAIHKNPNGKEDIGLAQVYDDTRKKFNSLYGRNLKRDDYFNPFISTEVAVLLFDRMLIEAKGNLELAIKAYNKGIKQAMRGKGEEYLALVIDVMQNLGEKSRSPSIAYIARGSTF